MLASFQLVESQQLKSLEQHQKFIPKLSIKTLEWNWRRRHGDVIDDVDQISNTVLVFHASM